MAGEQLQVRNALDVAKTQWYHFTAVIVAGMGFFTDAYDLFCISLVTKLIGHIYYHVDGSPKPGSLPPNVSAAVNGVAFCGTLTGQLFFGWLGDKLGRKRVYGLTLMLMCICSIASGLSFGKNPKAVMATLCFFRFWLGFGIGGDYPLSAAIMSEYANKKTRGAFIAAVFAMQGFGILAGGIFAIIISAAFDARFNAPAYAVDPVGSTVPQADFVWRIILMVGALPALLTYYWRMKMPETARYTALIGNDAKKAASDMGKVLGQDIEAKQKKAGQLNFIAAKPVMILIIMVAILSTTTKPLVAAGPLDGRKLSVGGGGGGGSELVPLSKGTPVRLPSPSSCTYTPGPPGSKRGSPGSNLQRERTWMSWISTEKFDPYPLMVYDFRRL